MEIPREESNPEEIPREESDSEDPPREESNPEEIHMARDISPSSVMGSAVTEQRLSRSCSRSQMSERLKGIRAPVVRDKAQVRFAFLLAVPAHLFQQRMEMPLIAAVRPGKCTAFPGGTIHLIGCEKCIHTVAVSI